MAGGFPPDDPFAELPDAPIPPAAGGPVATPREPPAPQKPARKPRPPRAPRRPLDWKTVAQALFALGLVIVLFAAIAPRVSSATAAGDATRAAEAERYLEQRVTERGLELRMEAIDGEPAVPVDEALVRYRRQLEAELDLAGLRQQAARSSANAAPRPWVHGLRIAGLFLLVACGLFLARSARSPLGAAAYLALVIPGLLAGGLGMASPGAGRSAVIGDASAAEPGAPTARRGAPMPASFPGRVELGWSQEQLRAAREIERSSDSTSELAIYRDAGELPDGAEVSYFFQRGELVQVAIDHWADDELSARYGHLPSCTIGGSTIHFGRIGSAMVAYRSGGREVMLIASDHDSVADMKRNFETMCESAR